MNERNYKIVLWETLKYQREAIVETDLEEKEFNNLLDEVEQRNTHPEDAVFDLRDTGVKIIKGVRGDYSSPMDAEFEIVDYVEVKEEKSD